MTVTTRPATPADSEALLTWRNDPDTRANSVSSDPVEPEAHADWLARVLNDPDRVLVIGEDAAGVAIGMVRFDLSSGCAETSINLAPTARGQALSAPLLRAAEHWITGRATVLLAAIKPTNRPSIRAFERAGYRPVASGSADLLRLEKRL
jgi:RimJ/RimL family protein N-acetyltransferase